MLRWPGVARLIVIVSMEVIVVRRIATSAHLLKEELGGLMMLLRQRKNKSMLKSTR
jgi:hypothetical protein